MESSEENVINPLRVIGLDSKKGDGFQSMGLVMSRAGIGKTAVLVQFALDFMMNGNNVLHVSIGTGLEKTRAWYNDIVTLLKLDAQNVRNLMARRMIMTFQEGEFSQAVLAKRIDDLRQQGKFQADCLVIDGFDFIESDRALLESLRAFAEETGIKMMWFSALCHRDDERLSAQGIPAPCHEVEDLFETVFLIDPEEKEIKLKVLKCGPCAVQPGAVLTVNPATMLLQQG
ncbi:hypothetical protein [Desulfotalea psychrophila]|nr:hypothetical protein [Desulfotalea psychrophila]